MKKRILSLVLIVEFVLSIIPTVYGESFDEYSLNAENICNGINCCVSPESEVETRYIEEESDLQLFSDSSKISNDMESKWL